MVVVATLTVAAVSIFLTPGTIAAQNETPSELAIDSEVVLKFGNGARETIRLLGIDERQIDYRRDGEVLSAEFDSVSELQFADVDTPPTKIEAAFEVVLTDGSLLHPNQLTSDGGQGLVAQLNDANAVSLPTKCVAHVLVGDLSEEQRVALSKILLQDSTEGDRLVVQQSSGALTKIDGIIQSVSDEAVTFEFSGQSVPVPFSKLAAFQYFRTPQSSSSSGKPAQGTVLDTLGNKFFFVNLSTQKDRLTIELACGFELEVPTAMTQNISFAAGNSKYLAELKPLRFTSKNLFDFPVDELGSEALFSIRTLPEQRLPGQSQGPSIEFYGDVEATYEVPEEFNTFQGAVQLSSKGDRYTTCQVAIYLENKLLWKSSLSDAKAKEPFEVEIEPDQRLRLETTSKSTLPTGNVVKWIEPILMK